MKFRFFTLTYISPKQHGRKRKWKVRSKCENILFFIHCELQKYLVFSPIVICLFTFRSAQKEQMLNKSHFYYNKWTQRSDICLPFLCFNTVADEHYQYFKQQRSNKPISRVKKREVDEFNVQHSFHTCFVQCEITQNQFSIHLNIRAERKSVMLRCPHNFVIPVMLYTPIRGQILQSAYTESTEHKPHLT